MAGQDKNKYNGEEASSDAAEDPGDSDQGTEATFTEEYDFLDTKLDELNSALDMLEQKNDDIHEKLKELLQSNREIREQLKNKNNEDEVMEN